MEKFLIHGGAPLSGTVVPAGNKNGALPILAASVLTEDEIVVRNVPRIKDVEAMLGLLDHMGVRVAWTGENEVTLCAGDLAPTAWRSTARCRSASGRRSCSRGPCWRVSAAP